MWPPAFQVYELSEVRTALERSRIEGAEAQLRIAHLQAEKSLLTTRVIVLEQLLACDLMHREDLNCSPRLLMLL